jgi:hypothetical protein
MTISPVALTVAVASSGSAATDGKAAIAAVASSGFVETDGKAAVPAGG